MRAKEFTINVPINIKINGDGDPEIDVAGQDTEDDTVAPDELDPNPVFSPPLQQSHEIAKASIGKDSGVIKKIKNNDSEHGAKKIDNMYPDYVGDPNTSKG